VTDPFALAGLVAIVALGFTVESAVGFGATVITVSMGALITRIGAVLPAYVPVNMALSAYLVARYRRRIAWGVLAARVAPFVAVGTPLGFLLGERIPERVGVRMFGLFVIVLALAEAWSVRAARGSSEIDPAPPESPLRTWARDAVAMTGCGVLFGMYGTGGPLAVWSVSRHARDPGVFRATLAALWLTLNGVMVARFLRQGAIDRRSLTLTALFIPALAIGTLAGERLHRAVSPRTFRSGVFALLFVVGVTLAVRR
jgi:uncharacterized membrane protein YfcA